MRQALYRKSKWAIIGRQIAHEAVRNSILENYHAEGKIKDTEMRELMLEVENNIRVSLWFWFGVGHYKNKEILTALAKQYIEWGISWDLSDEVIKKLTKNKETTCQTHPKN